jgi:hypothetical protein
VGRSFLTSEAAEDTAHQDRTAQRERRVLLHVIEEIRRGFHALDGFLHHACDTLEHRIDRGFGPVNRLLHLREPLHGTLNRRTELSGLGFPMTSSWINSDRA